ncbi:FxsA family protein [Pararhizobium haloflavum]|uniref:FxsA family protein n=1 Tax=Pararhizobium haloflavum TaxID=2037914 RepID=UPI000C1921DC|nr:FxsA family protein [Pararhizobium haloflavum]
MAFSLVPFLLLGIPLAEIAMFIVVGSQIGVLATLGLILFTAVLGSILLRVQGLGLLQRISEEAKAGRVPSRELIHGVMILIAGVLLLTPGFVTDTMGFLLFIPAVRDFGWKLIKGRITIVASQMTSGGGARHESARPRQAPGEPVIDLDDEDFQRHPSANSPWRNGTDGDPPAR